MAHRTFAPTTQFGVGSRQAVYFCEGAVQAVGHILQSLSVERILLVVDRPAYTLSGAAAALEAVFGRWQVESFDGFQLNPKIEDIARGVETFRRLRPQVVVAIGGGSALDVAKVVGTCGNHEAPPHEYVSGRLHLRTDGPPLIAIPTTAGTGSEATHFAVAYIAGEKYSLAHDFLLPEFAILDPTLTASLPRVPTIASGLDALCQAIESIWAVGATEDSLNDAYAAAELALQHLPVAALSPTPEARRAMLHAAHLAGRAINISKTTAPHAVSYALTTRYGVPHGIAVALTLGAFLNFNSQVDDASCADPRGVAHLRSRLARIIQLLGGGDVDNACARWQALLQQLDCPTRLRDVHVRDCDLADLAAQVNAERMANNPRRITNAALQKMLAAIY